jgi:hypothetical protein
MHIPGRYVKDGKSPLRVKKISAALGFSVMWRITIYFGFTTAKKSKS